MAKFRIPILIAMISGCAMVIREFIPHKPFDILNTTFQQWYMIIACFAILLGVGSLLSVHGEKIRRRRAGWWYSIVLIAGFVTMVFFGMVGGISERGEGFIGQGFNWMFEYMYNALQSTMFSILAFFVASAAYRAFRARTPEATLLLLAAFVVMLGRVTAGEYIYDKLPIITEWIMDYPNTAGQRAVMIGIGLGIVSTSLRIILGIEKSYLGRE
ncbi:hypothetical protein ACFL27_12695 [candidate division CSSED10-310 bacterium]|uniref:Prolipoprotein diacylglyceryl transferase n=1 Tax=candidate division CSSED10-310 bacterium TaxID=2855610 RepID=A0ABV6YXW8_UNCC1